MSIYKITDFNEASGQLTVEFAVGMAPLTIDVPINDGLYLSGDALHEYILGFIPTWHIERMAQINAGVANKEELKALVESAPVELPTVLTEEQELLQKNAEMWKALKFEQDVAKVLIKFGLLASDPTQIPVSQQ